MHVVLAFNTTEMYFFVNYACSMAGNMGSPHFFRVSKDNVMSSSGLCLLYWQSHLCSPQMEMHFVFHFVVINRNIRIQHSAWFFLLLYCTLLRLLKLLVPLLQKVLSICRFHQWLDAKLCFSDIHIHRLMLCPSKAMCYVHKFISYRSSFRRPDGRREVVYGPVV